MKHMNSFIIKVMPTAGRKFISGDNICIICIMILILLIFHNFLRDVDNKHTHNCGYGGVDGDNDVHNNRALWVKLMSWSKPVVYDSLINTDTHR